MTWIYQVPLSVYLSNLYLPIYLFIYLRSIVSVYLCNQYYCALKQEERKKKLKDLKISSKIVPNFGHNYFCGKFYTICKTATKAYIQISIVK